MTSPASGLRASQAQKSPNSSGVQYFGHVAVKISVSAKLVTRSSRASQMILARISYRTHRFVLQLRPDSNYVIASGFPCATFCTKKSGGNSPSYPRFLANSKRVADCVRTPWKPGWFAIRCKVRATSPYGRRASSSASSAYSWVISGDVRRHVQRRIAGVLNEPHAILLVDLITNWREEPEFGHLYRPRPGDFARLFRLGCYELSAEFHELVKPYGSINDAMAVSRALNSTRSRRRQRSSDHSTSQRELNCFKPARQSPTAGSA